MRRHLSRARGLGLAGASVLLVTLFACADRAAETPPEEAVDEEALQAARADSVQMAVAAFDPAAFDTISWNSPDEQLERGGVVWRFSCRKCHGDAGLGDGELARVEELDMPEILAADWEYAGDIPAIRRRIFIGHESEMPSWGLYGLKYRDIDAVASHIEVVLRAQQ